MNWLNYHHLYYFRVIANEGSIAEASRVLRLGQPTLSTQLKQLEDSLEVELFERRNRRLILTEPGRVVLDYANEIFRLGNEMVQSLQDRPVRDRIPVHIGAQDSIPKSIVISLSEAALNLSPCQLKFSEGSGPNLLQELSEHKIDLLLTNQSPPISEGQRVYARPVARMPVIVCGAPSFRHLKKDFPRSLQKQPVILTTADSKLRHDIEHFFRANNIQVDIIAETQDTAIQKLLGSQGHGLVLLAAPAAAELVDAKKLLPIGVLTDVYEEIWVVSMARRIQNPVAAKLFKTFKLSS